MTMHIPSHPGEVLVDWLGSLHTTVEEFAAKIGMDATELRRVVECKAPMTDDLSARISREFGQGDPGIWGQDGGSE